MAPRRAVLARLHRLCASDGSHIDSRHGFKTNIPDGLTSLDRHCYRRKRFAKNKATKIIQFI